MSFSAIITNKKHQRSNTVYTRIAKATVPLCDNATVKVIIQNCRKQKMSNSRRFMERLDTPYLCIRNPYLVVKVILKGAQI